MEREPHGTRLAHAAFRAQDGIAIRAKWQLAKAASRVYQARQAAQAWCGCVAFVPER
jgi:hypothetical protein